MGQKTYSAEFKRDSAALVLDQNYSHKEACAAVGVGVSAMRRWVNQLQAERGGHTPEVGKALTEEQLKIQQLNQKIKRLELEKEILKKATALLMSDAWNITH